MTHVIPVIGAAFCSFFILIWSMRRSWRGSIDYLPSIGWFFFIALPFFIEYSLFNPDTRDLHMAAMMVITVALFAADVITDKYRQPKLICITPDPTEARKALWLASVLGIIFAILSAWHLLSVDHIPLFDIVSGIGNEVTQSETRNLFSRDLRMCAFLRYVCNLGPNILAMPAVLIFLLYKKYIPAAILFAWVVFYAVAGAEKGPLSMAMLILCVGLVIITGTIRGQVILRRLATVALAGLVVLCILNVFSPYDTVLKNLPEKYAQNTQAMQARGAGDTSPMPPVLGDYERALSPSVKAATPWAWDKINYLIYRVFLTPVEVSARWYEYFSHNPIKGHAYTRLIQDGSTKEARHPANTIGRWAYYGRYPQRYTEHVYAYASVDADAYARFGWIGLVAVALMLAGMRLWIAFFDDANTVTHGAFYAVGITLMACLPASASLQAILIAQGLAVLCLIMMALRFADKFVKRACVVAVS